MTGGGAHVSLDALGSHATAAASVRSLRQARAGTCRSACCRRTLGQPPYRWRRVIAHELEIVGSHGMAAHDYPAMLATGGVRPAAAGPARDPRGSALDEAAEALAAMGEPGYPAGITVVAALTP